MLLCDQVLSDKRRGDLKSEHDCARIAGAPISGRDAQEVVLTSGTLPRAGEGWLLREVIQILMDEILPHVNKVGYVRLEVRAPTGEVFPQPEEFFLRAGEILPPVGGIPLSVGDVLPPVGESLFRLGANLSLAGQSRTRRGEKLPPAGRTLPFEGENLARAEEKLLPASVEVGAGRVSLRSGRDYHLSDLSKDRSGMEKTRR